MLDPGCPICARALGLPALRCTGPRGEVIAPGRHVAGWGDLTATEQLAMLSLISAALQDNARIVLRSFRAGVKVVIATKPVDFRKSHDGLTAVIEKQLERDLGAHLPLVKVNPLQARRFAQAQGVRAKSDAVDAKMLAEMWNVFALEPDKLADKI